MIIIITKIISFIKNFLIIFSLIIITLFLPKKIYSQIKINEIYPAPAAGEDEWVELYNHSNEIIDLSLYILYDLANNKLKIESFIIPPFGFIIATSSSVLNNTGDTVFLKNNLGEIIEIATYSGSFTNTKTFAKCPDGFGSWFILNLPTKKNSNSEACLILTPTPTSTPQPTPTIIILPTIFSTPTTTPTPKLTLTTTPIITPSSTPTPQTLLISVDNIYLSEVMVYPETGEKEWVEIYNNNDFEVSLQNWYLDDVENAGSSPKIFSLIIPQKSYAVWELSSSMFNNDGDSVRILDFNKNLKDSFEYSAGVKNKTYGRISFESDDFCLQDPSRGVVNNPCLNPTNTPMPTTTNSNINLNLPNATKTPIPLKRETIINNSSIFKNNENDKSNEQISVYSNYLLPQSLSQVNNQNQASVLGLKNSKTIINKNRSRKEPYPKSTAYLSSFCFSSISISLLNIGHLVLKILKKTSF